MARAGDVGTSSLVYEAAMALGAVAHDRSELVLACRQLIEHRPSSGPLVWLAARMLTGPDPGSEGWDAAEMIERDKTNSAYGRTTAWASWHRLIEMLFAAKGIQPVAGWPWG